MTQEIKFIFKSNGNYLGFIQNGFLFSRDGIYLGWVEGTIIWDFQGRFRGQLIELNGNLYALLNKFVIPPLPKTPKAVPRNLTSPIPQTSNIISITIPVGWVDAF